MDPRESLIRKTEECRRCGACLPVCDIAGALRGGFPADAVYGVASGTATEAMEWFVPRCSLCGRCVEVCPYGVDTPALIVEGRTAMLNDGTLDKMRYQAMFVDNDWNAISLFRDRYLPDAERPLAPCTTAFLPGCTLLNEGPQMTHAAHRWLQGALDEEVGIMAQCCGMPLYEMGFQERYGAYQDAFWSELKRKGVGKLIVACPNCLGRLAQRGSQEGIQVQLIYELMATMGLRAPLRDLGPLCIQDACPARTTQAGTWVRQLLSAYEIREMEHHGRNSACCGSGGAVGMFDPSLSELRASRRWDEFKATGARTCVVYCMSCCANLFRADEPQAVRHVLELVFDSPLDHAAYQERVRALWAGEAGRQSAQRLQDAMVASWMEEEGHSS